MRAFKSIFAGLILLFSSLPTFAQISCADLVSKTDLVLLKGSVKAKYTNSSRDLDLTTYQKAVRALRNLPEDVRATLIHHYEAQLQIYSLDAIPSAAMLLALDVPLVRVQEIVRPQLERIFQRVPTRGKKFLLSFDASVVSPQATSKGIAESPFIKKWNLGKFLELIHRVEQELLPEEMSRLGRYSGRHIHKFDSSGLTRVASVAQRLGMHEEVRQIGQILLTHSSDGDYAEVAHEMRNESMLFHGALYRLAEFYSANSSRYYYNTLYDATMPLRLIQEPALRAQAKDMLIDLATEIASPEFKERMLKDPATHVDSNPNIDRTLALFASTIVDALAGMGENILFYRSDDSVKYFVVTTSSDMRLRQAIRQLIDLSQGHEVAGFENVDNRLIRVYQTTGDREKLLERAVHFENRKNADGYWGRLAAMKYRLAAGDFEGTYANINTYLRQLNKKRWFEFLTLNDIARIDFTDLAFISAAGGTTTQFLAYLKKKLPEKAYLWVEQVFQKELRHHVSDTSRMTMSSHVRYALEAHVESNYRAALSLQSGRGTTTADQDLEAGRNYLAGGARIDLGLRGLLGYAFKRDLEKDGP